MSALPTPRIAMGTSQDGFRLVGSNLITSTGGALSTTGATFSFPMTLPAEQLAGSTPGVQVLTGLAPATLGQLKFVLGDADGETATCNVWGGKQISRAGTNGRRALEYTFTPLLSLTVTAGSVGWPAASTSLVEDQTFPLFLCDTIVVGTDWTRNDSAKVWGEMANAWEIVDFDLGGASAILIESLLGAGATRFGAFFAEC
jgi:hypothetical protein